MIQYSKLSLVEGRGVLNTLINKLPFELHLPERGDPGINDLDRACKEHDIAYSKSKDTLTRNQADLRLAEKAWERIKAADAKVGEKINAWTITNIMKSKAKLGMGLKQTNKITENNNLIRRKRSSKVKSSSKRNIKTNKRILNQLISKSRIVIKSKRPENVRNAIKLALTTAKNNLNGKQNSCLQTRVIPIPKTGGVLPFLVPLFAGLSALGALSGGASAMAKAVNSAKQGQKTISRKRTTQ
ncbi:hypothetical protein NQ317_005820 [Molorchus minor]|uniref:Uncharacterized protein n=1 Tax=Molorchus minor TaxID=1323400 RepID=A0ABQ9IQ54_9CUCU|nr:hypothetical protein NQ317_005820 [Molorchus minor]